MRFVAIVALAMIPGCATASEGPIFNGTDLAGWVNVNGSPGTWSARDGMIVCSGKPIGMLRTERMYENFILELEYRHLTPKGNAGLFVHSDPVFSKGVPFPRAIEIQIIDGDSPEGVWTGHGDVFAIHGAKLVPDRPHPKNWMRCLPSERRARPAGEWNHYRVESRDGRITLAVNGKVVTGVSDCRPRRGYIALESEGAEVHFRDLSLQELPSSSPPVEEQAQADAGFRPLYNGTSLDGWNQEGAAGEWKAMDWTLLCNGSKEGKNKHLWTEKEYGDFILIADWRLPGEPEPRKIPVILPNGDHVLNEEGKETKMEIMDYGDSGIFLRGSAKSSVNIWCWPIGSGEVWGYRTDSNLPAEVRAGVTPKMKADADPGKWNRFVLTLKGDRLTVVLNDQTVIDQAQLPGIAPRGPIALQHYGFPIEFANLFIKELN